MYSYSGKCLLVDLSRQKAETADIPESVLKEYLGGVGLGARLLCEEQSGNVDPLSPENPLVFASSAFAGTMIPASAAHAVVTKSPLTGLMGDSLCFGNWSIAFKSAGYDAMIITGESPSLTYLFIDDGIVHFRDAEDLAGQGTSQTASLIRRELGDDTVQVASIGPGGESLVRYACIHDGHRQAGRTGCGAVMGSKKLKAIAVRGSRAVSVSSMKALRPACAQLYSRAQAIVKQGYRALGTPNNTVLLNRVAALPTRNFQHATFEHIEEISGEYLAEKYLEKILACPTCPIACEHVYRVKDGQGAASPSTPLDYGALSALGPMCGISSVPAILEAVRLCEFYGIDAISTGSSIAWAMECAQRGIVPQIEADNVEIAFGNPKSLLQMVHWIGKRTGLGELLGDGVKRASAVIGNGSDHWAMHSKGMELPGYEPRNMKTQALAFATGLRGGYRNRSSSYELDMVQMLDQIEGEPGWGRLNMELEDMAAAYDSLAVCKSMRAAFGDFQAEAAALYSMVTGIDISPAGIRQAGERINNLKKIYNIKQGWKRADDWLPPRLLSDPVIVGDAVSALTPQELTALIDDYYRARGWTKEGLVPIYKINELGLGGILEGGDR